MFDLAHLKASCNAVLARHKLGPRVASMCIVCGKRVCGQMNIVEHYIAAHNIYFTHVDNIVDLDGFFNHLRELLLPRDDGNVRCPVCAKDCGAASLLMSSLAEHIAGEEHNRWDVDTIPALAQFCVAAVNTTTGNTEEQEEEEEEEEEAEEDYEEKEERNNDNDSCADWDVEPSQCLFCETVSEEPLRHMEEAHDVNFRAAIRAHEGVRDVYDVIRIVNAIRRCVANNVCPYYYCDDSAQAELCRSFIVASSLSEHLRANHHHVLPRVVPSADRELIPFLPGDAFISYVLGSVKLMAQEEEDDPDYPMVPTISEMAKMRRTNEPQSTSTK